MSTRGANGEKRQHRYGGDPVTSENVLTLWGNVETNPHKFDVDSELPRPLGWTVLVRMVPCPGGCVGGEVWGGDDLAACPVCDGAFWVAVGIGGGQITRSWKVPIPEEPSEFFYVNEVRHFIQNDGLVSHTEDQE